MLPDGVGVLGVDEHTAVELDLSAVVTGLGEAAGTGPGTGPDTEVDPALVRVRVLGTGGLTARYRGLDTVYPTGSTLTLAELTAALAGHPAPGTRARASGTAATSSTRVGSDFGSGLSSGSRSDSGSGSPSGSTAGPGSSTDPMDGSLAAATERLRVRFDEALAAKDVETCVAAVLDLEQAIVDWSTDTLQSDDGARARRLLRSCVVRLGELAHAGAGDPSQQVGPYVEALLELRTRARTAKDYATSDVVRDRLVAAGVEVKDTPDGVTWSLKA